MIRLIRRKQKYEKRILKKSAGRGKGGKGSWPYTGHNAITSRRAGCGCAETKGGEEVPGSPKKSASIFQTKSVIGGDEVFRKPRAKSAKLCTPK